MTTKETLHLKKPKIVRSTPQEDFAAATELKPKMVAGLEAAYEYVTGAASEEVVATTRRDLDEITLLDMFAMQVSAGVAKRLEDPGLIAVESFRIGQEMVKMSLRHRQKK